MQDKSKIIEEIRSVLEDNIPLNKIYKTTIGEAWSIIQDFSSKIVRKIEIIGKDLTGKEKKQIVLEVVSKFYDSTFVIVGIPLVPNFLEPIIHKYVKSVLMLMISKSIDLFVRIFKEVGIFNKKGDN
jgi:hypothetical protein